MRLRDHIYADREPLGPWAALAECRGLDPQLFFPTRGDMESMREAKAVCAACPVRAECLTHERERRTIARARRRAA